MKASKTTKQREPMMKWKISHAISLFVYQVQQPFNSITLNVAAFEIVNQIPKILDSTMSAHLRMNHRHLKILKSPILIQSLLKVFLSVWNGEIFSFFFFVVSFVFLDLQNFLRRIHFHRLKKLDDFFCKIENVGPFSFGFCDVIFGA